jgi:hypothetical protein
MYFFKKENKVSQSIEGFLTKIGARGILNSELIKNSFFFSIFENLNYAQVAQW